MNSGDRRRALYSAVAKVSGDLVPNFSGAAFVNVFT